MTKKNVVEQTKERITELLMNRKNELLKIQDEIQAEKALKKEAETEIREATENTNIEAYEKAINKKRAIVTKLEMYEARKKMLEENDYVTEMENAATIKALFNYAEKLTEEFEAGIKEPIKTLEELLQTYQKEFNETLLITNEWQQKIESKKHATLPYHQNRSKFVNVIRGTMESLERLEWSMRCTKRG